MLTLGGYLKKKENLSARSGTYCRIILAPCA